MRRRTKTITLPFPKEAFALGFLFFIVAALFAGNAFGKASPIRSCRTVESLKKQKASAEATLRRYEAEGMTDALSGLKADIISREAAISDAQAECDNDQGEFNDEQESCKAKKAANPGLYETDEDGKCVVKEIGMKSNPNEGECSSAEILRGTNLRGEACKETADTISSVQARQEALTGATTAAVTGYSAFQAQQATGAQMDAQAQQTKILQTLAISKMATGAMQLAGGAQLRSAANNAESAASDISGAHQKLSDACANAQTKEGLSSEQCFYKYAPKYDIVGSAKELATFERLMMAKNQSNAQAERAKSASTASMLAGAADAFVGIQALMMSRQTTGAVTQMGALPPPPGTQGYSLSGAGQGMSTSGAAPPVNNNGSPTDFGNGGDPNAFIGGNPGGVGNGIKSGKGFGASPNFNPAKSTVSTSGGGGAGGGGGGGGNNGGRSQGRGGMLSETGKNPFDLGGGGGGSFRGAGAGPAQQAEGGNAFAEALSKLFPQDQSGKPVVELSRQIASEQPEGADDSFAGSEVQAVDVSLFEQITSKYRQLTGSGTI